MTGLIVVAVIINILLVVGATAGVRYYAQSFSYGTASVGFEGTPENGVSAIYLTVTEITFQGGANTSDSVYLSQPVTLNLLSLINVTRMLGDVAINPGH
jgi:hypothetical protein